MIKRLLSRQTLLLVSLFFSSLSFAQHNFWFNTLTYKRGIIQNGTARSWSDGSFASSCKAYFNPSQRIYQYKGKTGDGLYTISHPTLGKFNVWCDMTNGGYTLLSAGGTVCGLANYKVKASDSILSGDATSSATYTASCGFLPSDLVASIATTSTIVRLRGGSTPTASEVTSSGVNTLAALRNKGNWHNGAQNEWSGWSWTWSCASTATSWPSMFHACNNGAGVHWMEGLYQSRQYSPQDAYSSTWIK